MYITLLGARVRDLRADRYNIIERRVEGKSYSQYKLIPAVAPMMPEAFGPKPAEANQSLFNGTQPMANVPDSPGMALVLLLCANEKSRRLGSVGLFSVFAAMRQHRSLIHRAAPP